MKSKKKIMFSSKPNGIRAVGLVFINNQILLMRRENQGKEYYTFPGGGVEFHETVEEAVVREIKEECNFEVKVIRLLYHHDLINDSDHFFYLCEYQKGNLQLGGEEFDENEKGNIHEPLLFPIPRLNGIVLYPLEVRDWIIIDYPDNFQNNIRRLTVAVSELRNE